MAYIGNTPAENYVSIAAQHFTVSATTSYSLNQSVTNETELALFINNVRQQPGSSYSYTATGTTLTLSVATLATDTMYCVFLGKSVGTIAPPDGSVGTATLATGAVTADKIADGTVVAAEIADGAVTDAKISAVATTKLTGTVTDAQIAAVATSKLTGTVTNAQIADLDAAKLTGTVADARLSTVTSSKLSGALPAVSGASLTGLTAGNITGVIPAANLGTGTANSGTFLNGSGAYSEAGGGAWTLIATVVASNSASLTITGLDSTYDTYAVAFSDLVPASDGQTPQLRVGDSGGLDTGNSDYSYLRMGDRVDNTSFNLTGMMHNAVDRMNLMSNGAGNAAGEGFGGMMFVHNPQDSTSRHTFTGQFTCVDNNSAFCYDTFGGQRNTVINLDRINFQFQAGNITSGRMTVWGIAHA